MDLGLKFVPNFYKNKNNFLRSFLINLDNSLIKFNQFVFFSKINYLKRNDTISNNKYDKESLIFKINKFINSKSKKTMNLQQETLVFRDLIIRSLSKNKFKDLRNLSDAQISVLNMYLFEKPFLILPCDKNIGFALIKKDLYIELANEHLLSNDITYCKLNYNPLKLTIDGIKKDMVSLYNNGHISKRLFDKIKFDNCKMGKFKMMPKIHKSKFGIRPIVASINHPTEVMSFVIDRILKVYVNNSHTVLRDSQNLIQNTEDLNCGVDTELYTMDFASLYTNMNSKHTIETIMDFLTEEKFKCTEIDSYGLFKFLEMIFYKNIFTFNGQFFIQKNGLAMGSICGPSVANIYLYVLERHWAILRDPLFYCRFIDDIFMASKGKANLEEVRSLFGDLKLEISNEKTVNFLDLKISREAHDRLKFDLYVKPTNAGQFLQKSSGHPSHMFKNIPKSSFIRIKRNCSSSIDYLFHSRDLYFLFCNRGYNSVFIIKIMRIINRINRKDIIPYKNKNTGPQKNTLRMFLNHDLNYLNLSSDIYSNFKILKESYDWLKDSKLLFSNSISPNLKKILIDNFKTESSVTACTRKCDILGCKTCPYIMETSALKLSSNFTLPLKRSGNCESKGVVYVIKCSLCNVFYIGETGKSAKLRIFQHIKNILNFVPFERSTEVAEHFNIRNHRIQRDFNFSIFDRDIFEKKDRLDCETDVRHIIEMFRPVLNIKKPNHLYINKLCYS